MINRSAPGLTTRSQIARFLPCYLCSRVFALRVLTLRVLTLRVLTLRVLTTRFLALRVLNTRFLTTRPLNDPQHDTTPRRSSVRRLQVVRYHCW